MKPRGQLMIEHRLIEKMLVIIIKEIERVQNNRIIDPVFINTAVDFIKTYADRTHHGKEEDILFKELEKKDLSANDQAMMDDLIREHQEARNTVKEIIETNEKYINGKNDVFNEILRNMKWLIDFYPRHIQKEDKIFFPNTEKYFNETELNTMLNNFLEFDRRMIHEKYIKLVDDLRKKYI